MSEHVPSPLGTLLQSTSLGSVFAEPRYVVSFDHTTTIGEALETLSRHRILSAPVVVRPDEGFTADTEFSKPGKPLVKALIGFVSVGDILDLYLQVLDKNYGSRLQEEDLENAGTEVCTQPVLRLFGENAKASPTCMLASNSDTGRDWGLKGNVGESLLSVIRRGFLSPHEGVAPPGHTQQVVHRLAVFDCAEGPLDAPPHLLGIFSQMDAVRFLAQHVDTFGPLGSRTIQQLNLLKQHPVTVSTSTDTIQAFRTMYNQKVSAAAVVGQDGTIDGNLSVSDLRCLAPGLFSALLLPVEQYLLHRPLLAEVQQELSSQAMELEMAEPAGAQSMETEQSSAELIQGSHKAAPFASQNQIITCTPDTTFSEVVQLAAKNSVHRVWVVESGNKPVSSVTLTDILHTVVSAV